MGSSFRQYHAGQSTLHRHKFAFLAGVAIALQPSALLAQDAGETVLDSIQVEAESDDILVQDGYVAKADRIGTKVDTPLVQIPQAVSVVTQDQIEDQSRER